MTTTVRSVKHTEEETKVVPVCDFCDLAEPDLAKGVSMCKVSVNPELIFSSDDMNGSGAFGDGATWPSPRTMSAEVEAEAKVRVEEDSTMDFCTHCLDTLFEH